MLACNSIPGVICGYTPTPQDAFLFGRINAGNAVSFPLGLNYGWSGELNLRYTLDALFEQPFGTGYPSKDAERKRKDTRTLKTMQELSKISIIDFLNALDEEMCNKILKKKNVVDYILTHGKDGDILCWIKQKFTDELHSQRRG